MFRKLRNSIWKLVTGNLKEGTILPRWAYCIRGNSVPVRISPEIRHGQL